MAFETYQSRRLLAQLMTGAEELLARLIRSGCSHSVLSLSAHNGLTQQISDLGVASLLLRVDGRMGPSARSKKQPLAKHVAMLRETVGDCPIVVIGDALDDVRAAFANRVHAVPYVGGLTHAGILRQSGLPVAESLAEAAALAIKHAHSAN
ncbi:HAD family hydrolase [Streptomyces sp. NPDC057690]|uniref:HAD family hydrolase n=1 Tax=Streptomyces sp. NPDC057690 TaxID=3346214 RepID=UPI0036A6D7C9